VAGVPPGERGSGRGGGAHRGRRLFRRVFTLAEAKGLIGPAAKADPSADHAVDFAGQRNLQCAYSSGMNGLADLQMLLPLNDQAASQLKASFAGNEVTLEGASVKCIGAEAFWKTKVGTPGIYVLTSDDVSFNIGSTTNGTNSASEAQLEQVATKMVGALAQAAGGTTPVPPTARGPVPGQRQAL